jgi:hypothetical protein
MEAKRVKEIRNFLKWYQGLTDCPFTKKGLWKISNECESADLEVYWDYRDHLNEEQIERILENGREGYDEVENELYDLNYDQIITIREEFLEDLGIEESMLTKSYKQYTMETLGCEEDEVVECAKDELFEFIKDHFEILVDLNFDEIVKNTSGEVWIDCDDVYWMDIINQEKIEENIEEILYFNYHDTQIDSRRYKDSMEDALGTPDITELEEAICFSVRIADSLDEYVEMMVEHEEKYREEAPEKKWIVEINGNCFELSGTPYLSTRSQYREEPENLMISLVDQDDAKIANGPTIENFYERIFDAKEAYVTAYLEKHLHNPNRKDGYGRSLIHYAILSGNMGFLREAANLMTIDGIYEEDDYGITPFSLLFDTEIVGDQLEGSIRNEMFKELYLPQIKELPLENESADCWETASVIALDTKEGRFMAIERDGFDYDNENLFECLNTLRSPRLYAANIETGELGWLDFENIQSLTFTQEVKICLDGSIVA